MALFGKKRRKLPPLPDIDDEGLPPLPEEGFRGPPAPMPMRPRLARPPKEFPPMPEEEEDEFPPLEEPMPRRPTIRPFKPIEPTPMHEPERATVFIKIDKYKDVVHNLERMQKKIDELQEALDRITTIKNKEAEIIDGWYSLLQSAKSKVDQVNAKLSKPEDV